MTDFTPRYWKEQKGLYRQPLVLNPPSGQNANNARHAIWHLGRIVTLFVYPTRNGWQEDGRYNQGEPVKIDVRAVAQPLNSDDASSQLMSGIESSYTEGFMLFHVDSHDPFNIKAVSAHSEIFPNGLRILGPDDRGTDGLINFSMAFQLREKLWKVSEVKEYLNAGDENLDTEGAIYRAECILWRDTTHERDADSIAPVWGPDRAI